MDSWLTHLEQISPTLKVGVGESCPAGRIFLLGLLGPTDAGPGDEDGWFASDFALAHALYGGIVHEQSWLTSVDLLEEVARQGPYLWGHPKNDRTVVFSENDPKFYTVCSPQGLITKFKNKLQEIVASIGVEDRLLLLIFAHGEKANSSGILVGVDAYNVPTILTAEEVNDLLQPLSGGPAVTLITSACYSGVWHRGTAIGTRVAASNCDEESLSLPVSDSGCARGGFFWGAIWYELSRLGIWVAGEEVPEDGMFRTWSDNIKKCVQDMFIFHPAPTVSVPEEAVWTKHAKEVLCYDAEGETVSSSHLKVPANPNPESVAGTDVHFPGGYMKVLALPLAQRLPTLMDYLSTSNIGLPNAASNIGVFQLARLYRKGLASKDDLVRLDRLLSYRVVEDCRAERILNFLRIPRVCSISNFKQWMHRAPEMSPFIQVVSSIMPFSDPPKMKPLAYRYTKPVTYVAWTAYMAKVDVEWLNTNLCLYMQNCSSSAGESGEAGESSPTCVDSRSSDAGQTSGGLGGQRLVQERFSFS